MPQMSSKEKILAAAVEVLHRNGFNATGVQDIATFASVPKGSIFNHFENKEDLCLKALNRYWQAGLERLATLSDQKVAPLKRLKTYFRGLSQAVASWDYSAGCMIGNFALEMPPSSSLIREQLAAVFSMWSHRIAACVREAQADGSIRDDMNADKLANFLLNSWQGSAMRAKVNKDGSSFTEFESIFKTLRP